MCSIDKGKTQNGKVPAKITFPLTKRSNWWHIKEKCEKKNNSLSWKPDSVITSKKATADVSLSVSLKGDSWWSICAWMLLSAVLSPSAKGMLISSVRENFHAAFLIIILKDERWRKDLDLPAAPPGMNPFNYFPQMLFCRTWKLEGAWGSTAQWRQVPWCKNPKKSLWSKRWRRQSSHRKVANIDGRAEYDADHRVRSW